MKRTVTSLSLLLVLGVSLWVIAEHANVEAQATASVSAVASMHSSQSQLAPDCSPDWSIVPSPNMGPDMNSLRGIVALSSSDAWAVGYWGHYGGSSAFQTLIEHWDGSVWGVVASPNMSTINALNGVAAISSSDVWAVGDYSIGSNQPQTLIEHWDGNTWSVVPSPSPDMNYSVLIGLAPLSSSDVWAVGSSRNSAQALIEHWDGSTWSVVPSPGVSTENTLSGVTALSGNDMWAVGYYLDGSRDLTLTEHWDGSTWSVVPSPGGGTSHNYLFGVAALSSSNIWAVGNYSIGTSTPTLIERYSPCSGTPTPTVAGTPPTSIPTATACAIAFSDVLINHPFYPYIRCLVCRGIISGYSDGTFRPDNNITRGQTAKIVSNAANINDDPGPQIFEDVDPSNSFYIWVNRLSNREYMSGYPCGGEGEPCNLPLDRPYFRPFTNATRGQLSKIVSNAAGFGDTGGKQLFTDVPLENSFYLWIQRLASRGIIGGYACGGPSEPCDDQQRPYFRPFNNVTRGQASKIVANTFLPNCQTPMRK